MLAWLSAIEQCDAELPRVLCEDRFVREWGCLLVPAKLTARRHMWRNDTSCAAGLTASCSSAALEPSFELGQAFI